MQKGRVVGFKAEPALRAALVELASKFLQRSVSALLRKLAWEYVESHRAHLSEKTRLDLERAPKVRGRYRHYRRDRR